MNLIAQRRKRHPALLNEATKAKVVFPFLLLPLDALEEDEGEH